MSEEIVSSGKAWAKQLIDLYREGASDAEVAADLNITIKDYYKQLGENSTLATLVDLGRTLSQAFWEGQARKNIRNKQFNTPLWAFYMKNKFGWADKTEAINLNDNSSTDLDQLRSQLAKDVGRFVRENTPELTDAQRVIQSIAAQANG